MGMTHLLWYSIESKAVVRKGVIKARVLTGIYILQPNRHIFSGRSVEPKCHLCCSNKISIILPSVSRHLCGYSTFEADSAGTVWRDS